MKMGKSKKEKKEKKHKKHKKEKKEKEEHAREAHEAQRSSTSGGFASGLADALQQRCEEGLDSGPRVSASQRRHEEEKRETERLYQERLYNKPRADPQPDPQPVPQPSHTRAPEMQVEERHVQEDDINAAAASLMRAQMAGQTAKLARLKRNLENLETAKKRGIKIRIKRKATAAAADAVTRTSRLGMDGRAHGRGDGGGDADSSIADLARHEKRRSGRDVALEFTKMQMAMEFDDHFEGESETPAKKQKKEKEKEERPRVKKERPLNTCCDLCLHNRKKHLVLAVGEHCFLTVPSAPSLVEGHCLIVPRDHLPSGVHLDEDVWDEVLRFRQQVAKMVRRQHGDQAELVVLETVMQLHRFPHAVFECVPVFENEDIPLLPAYFKKSFMEAGPRWASNKKVVELTKKKLKHAVPKGFPYVSVSFELQCDVSMAHVIEDESVYSKHFAKEIVGGMMGLDATSWRNEKEESVDLQMRKVVEFEQHWRDFDIWENE